MKIFGALIAAASAVYAYRVAAAMFLSGLPVPSELLVLGLLSVSFIIGIVVAVLEK